MSVSKWPFFNSYQIGKQASRGRRRGRGDGSRSGGARGGVTWCARARGGKGRGRGRGRHIKSPSVCNELHRFNVFVNLQMIFLGFSLSFDLYLPVLDYIH